MRQFQTWAFMALTALILVVAAEAGEAKKAAIILTSSEPESSGFGLAVANAMHDAGIDSTLFLAGQAADLAKTSGYQPPFGGGPSPREMIASLLKKGGKVFVCEGFMKMHQLETSQLVKGVAVGTPATLVSALYATGTQVLSF